MSDLQKVKEECLLIIKSELPIGIKLEVCQGYIKELEKMNKEMVELYIKIYKWCQTTEMDISLVMMTEIKDIIEKHEGKPVEEILIKREINTCGWCNSKARILKSDNKITCSNEDCIISNMYFSFDGWNNRRKYNG